MTHPTVDLDALAKEVEWVLDHPETRDLGKPIVRGEDLAALAKVIELRASRQRPASWPTIDDVTVEMAEGIRTGHGNRRIAENILSLFPTPSPQAEKLLEAAISGADGGWDDTAFEAFVDAGITYARAQAAKGVRL